MAVKGSADIVIEASPEQVLDAVAAVEDLPRRSGSHQSAVVESRTPDGRPQRVRAKVSAVGMTDEEVTDYAWDEPSSVSWTLVESGFQAVQNGTYTLTPTGGGTKVRLDLEIDVKIPLPGLIQKRILKGALDTGTKGLKTYIESR
ncbi:MAG TPA: SRPBCC family protein [Aeromicrobium sp.]|nr:SRPBCC family protein [Aeromicrobium sp.]